jgi:hypothetical protein
VIAIVVATVTARLQGLALRARVDDNLAYLEGVKK